MRVQINMTLFTEPYCDENVRSITFHFLFIFVDSRCHGCHWPTRTILMDLRHANDLELERRWRKSTGPKVYKSIGAFRTFYFSEIFRDSLRISEKRQLRNANSTQHLRYSQRISEILREIKSTKRTSAVAKISYRTGCQWPSRSSKVINLN